jgi:hypothetical protein
MSNRLAALRPVTALKGLNDGIASKPLLRMAYTESMSMEGGKEGECRKIKASG